MVGKGQLNVVAKGDVLAQNRVPNQLFPTFRIEALRFDEYSSGTPCIPIAQAWASVLVLLRQVDDEGPLWREKQPRKPDTVMEDPPCGWRLGRLAVLVWNRGAMVLERGANAGLQGRIHPHTPSHAHA
jgi:hypothetical protein